MGNTSYSMHDRKVRATTSGFFASKSFADVSTQSHSRIIHESMRPDQAKLREARDSAVHPRTVPIILGMDVTGSMGQIPHFLIKDGLPHMISGIIQAGVPDPALLFLPIGDHEADRFPLQVAQFESGDAELDMWLTRTYLEGGGGGNTGESYLLAWYYAAFHTITDAWEKRKEKGFIFTIGDEPGLRALPARAIQALMGEGQKTYTDKELLEAAQEKWNVYHIHVAETSAGRRSETHDYWREMLGQNHIVIEQHQELARTIAKLVVDNSKTIAVMDSSVTEPTLPTDVKPHL